MHTLSIPYQYPLVWYGIVGYSMVKKKGDIVYEDREVF